MKKYHLDKIDIQSIARIYLVLGLALGLIFGIITMILISTYEPMRFGVTLLTTFLIICFYAVVGAGIMAFFTWVYNVIASKVGGIGVYLSEDKQITHSPIDNDKRI